MAGEHGSELAHTLRRSSSALPGGHPVRRVEEHRRRRIQDVSWALSGCGEAAAGFWSGRAAPPTKTLFSVFVFASMLIYPSTPSTSRSGAGSPTASQASGQR